MRVLYFVFKMIVVVLIIGFAVRMVSSAVFKPKPIETIPDRYAQDSSRIPSSYDKNQANVKSNSKSNIYVSADEPSKEVSNTSGSNIKGESNNLSDDILNDPSPTDVNEYLKERGLSRLIPEKYIKLMEKLSLKDKLTGISLFAKISTSDQEELFNVIKDGVNEEEYGDVNQILKRNLDEKDFVTLREIVSRFALIQ